MDAHANWLLRVYSRGMRLCSFPDCGRPFLSKGLCQSHYAQQRRGEDLREIREQPRLPVVACSFEGCDRARLTRSGLCGPHRRQQFSGQELHPLRVARSGSCRFEDCDRGPKAYGWCEAHWKQQKRGSELRPIHVPANRYRHVNGYILLNLREHPNANKNGHVFEHVKVMSDHLGRPLVAGENVHHVNGVKDDNRLGNLELWNTHQPKGQRVEDKVSWAVEILRLYRPDCLADEAEPAR